MNGIKTRKTNKDGLYFIMLNGTNVGRVFKCRAGWMAGTTAAGYDHIIVTEKTKKAAVENWVHAYLTDGREGY